MLYAIMGMIVLFWVGYIKQHTHTNNQWKELISKSLKHFFNSQLNC